MTDQQILEIALANGFKLKEQSDETMELNPYVYKFARALLSTSQDEIDALNEQLGLCEGTLDSRNRNISALLEESAVLKAKVKRYQIINTPEIKDFILAIERESLHQRERWGSNHDAGKADSDWFWLIGYLAGKAIRPDATPEKQLHRIVAAAAACLNWHAAKLGVFTDMRHGIEEPK